MHILLINTNPVVSRLVSLCVRNEETVLEEVTSLTTSLEKKHYDLVLVDDASYIPGMPEALQILDIGKSVFLVAKNTEEHIAETFDEVIHKPFLPSEITALMEDLSPKLTEDSELSEDKEVESAEEAQAHFIFPLSSDDTESTKKPMEEDETKEASVRESKTEQREEVETVLPEVKEVSEVLNPTELERIKALLDEDDETDILGELEDDTDYETRKVEVITEHLEADGLEIVSEDEIVDLLSNSEAEEKKKKIAKKKAKKEKKKIKEAKEKSKAEGYTFEEALIAAIEGMKVKKIKKLLKDADISIQIKFKDKV